MHALTSVCGKRPATTGPGTFFDLSPRMFLLLYWLASFRTIPGNLQKNRINKNEWKGHLAKRRKAKETEKKTHMTVRLALVARLHGGLCAVHVFRDRVRRRQAVADGHAKYKLGSAAASLSIGLVRPHIPCHVIRPTATIALDGRERRRIQSATRRRRARHVSAGAATTTTPTAGAASAVFRRIIGTHPRDMPKVATILQ
jgi:hypothetical protein